MFLSTALDHYGATEMTVLARTHWGHMQSSEQDPGVTEPRKAQISCSAPMLTHRMTPWYK
jgi:hypothetical protein